ncbi:helix-turn-helix domain-containing protein [Cupriavidus campinensis]|uniref:Helix-turn-helix domain-containing protein n=1 Tax=Cupriavidus campinensis TaxID=151783 RepID=A0ABY3EKG6_9BURK|nr:helix-turn-helix domain-containing protein [Cupriavidus campinensis]TSP11447.1 helix-turn-helix domain-containing protein [Cupriavidus campinensis]
MARPTSYKAEYAEQAFKLCLLGATDAEMADIFGVTEQTLNNWKTSHPEFFESIKSGKAAADANVASRLYQRAMGYTHPAVKIVVVGGEIKHKPYTEHYPPDTAAGIFWLKNRRKKDWRDKIEQELSGPGGSPLGIDVTFRKPDAD